MFIVYKIYTWCCRSKTTLSMKLSRSKRGPPGLSTGRSADSRRSKVMPPENESFTSINSLKVPKNSRRLKKSPKRWFGIRQWTGFGFGNALRSSHSRSSLGFFHSAMTSVSSFFSSFFLSFSLILSSSFLFLASSALFFKSSLNRSLCSFIFFISASNSSAVFFFEGCDGAVDVFSPLTHPSRVACWLFPSIFFLAANWWTFWLTPLARLVTSKTGSGPAKMSENLSSSIWSFARTDSLTAKFPFLPSSTMFLRKRVFLSRVNVPFSRRMSSASIVWIWRNKQFVNEK